MPPPKSSSAFTLRNFALLLYRGYKSSIRLRCEKGLFQISEVPWRRSSDAYAYLPQTIKPRGLVGLTALSVAKLKRVAMMTFADRLGYCIRRRRMQCSC
jgi:hypothetical protein